jgi:CheY-like chemotaxis protein
MTYTAPTRIFIVGGDNHFNYLMRRYARRIALQVTFKDSDEDFLKTLELFHPAAIIIELSQPETASWRSIDHIKRCPQTKDIPILVCSWQDDHERVRLAGADYHIRMPILFQEFTNALRSIGLNT